ncbi:zinc finger, C3HC4 type [Cooperia oncophora]
MSVQPCSNETAGDPMDHVSPMDTTEQTGSFLQVPANFEILMRCSICMEIFHNPATVSPCNHKFCYSCLLSWKRTNQTAVCPQCRGPIHSMQKDAQFNEIVESFLQANPSKRRSSSELESLDAMETECTEWQNGNQRGRRRGSMPQPRNRSVRDRTVRTPLLVRVSQIRAHRPAQRQRGHRGILEDWFNL